MDSARNKGCVHIGCFPRDIHFGCNRSRNIHFLGDTAQSKQKAQKKNQSHKELQKYKVNIKSFVLSGPLIWR